MMNSQQEKSFELLQIFVGICDKWDIPYYLVCGTALGAIKYQGFIPWDDDIDVGLLRKDYNRFLEIAPKELPEWCFLQNHRTEPLFPHAFSKLRNSNTTFIEKGMAKLPINHGIYLDIFPIDGQPAGAWEKKQFHLHRKFYSWIQASAIEGSPKRKVRIRNRIFRILGYHKRTAMAMEKLERLYSQCPPETSEFWCNYGNWQGKLEYAPRWHYGNGTYAVFEGLKVRIPENYDAYLTQKYGDWRADPPLELQKSHHLGIVVDTEVPYTQYWQKLNL